MLELNRVALFSVSWDSSYDGGTMLASAITDRLVEFGDYVLAASSFTRFDKRFLLPSKRVMIGEERVSSLIPKIDCLSLLNEGITHILSIHHDGHVINPLAWNDEFLDFDYIGSAWPDGVVGNNGFCLMSVKMLETIRDIDIDESIKFSRPSDVVTCRYKFREGQDSEVICIRRELEDAGIRYAPLDVANKFSVENQEYAGQLGFHGLTTLASLVKRGKR